MSGQSAEAKNIASFFKDPDASSVISVRAQQIAAPVVRGQDITVDEQMQGGGTRALHFVLDRSPSMEPVAQMLLADFNNELIAGIIEAREDDTSVLRIGGTSFSSDITPIWVQGGIAYHALDKLPKLTVAEYDVANGCGTALHAAILDAVTRATKYAADLQSSGQGAPDIDIVILSDGANNENPRLPDSVKQVVVGANKQRIRFIYFYFETGDGLADPKGYAQKELGIDGENIQVFSMKSGESQSDRRKRFRRMVRVMSRVSASKGQSAVQAAAAAAAAPNAADDDL